MFDYFLSFVRFGSKADIDGLPVRLRNVLVFDRNYVAFPALLDSCHSALWSVCRLLPRVWKDILVAHADPYTTSQSPELRPHNWEISVEGERWQSCFCWFYSRRKKWEGLPSNSHWWSTLFGKSPCLALYDRQVAELRNQLCQR